MEKYKFTEEKMFYNGRVLKRIIRIEDNLVGGWIESEKNLSQSGKCFVYGNAKVYGNATIHGNAEVYDNAKVLGNAIVCGEDEIENGHIQVSYKDVQTYKNKSSRTVTALLTNDGWRFNVGCQKLITKEVFLYRIHNNDGGLYKNPHREFYLKILSLF